MTNFGTIVATYEPGVLVQDGGSVSNGQAGSTSALITGGNLGVANYYGLAPVL